MKQNVGTIERVIRAVIGVGIIAAGALYQNWWGAIGAVPLLTAIIGWCPPYAMLGISTCRAEVKTEA